MAHLLISGVDYEIGEGSKGPVAPESEFDIELRRAGTHLGGTDLMSAELLGDLRDLTGRDALHEHLPSLCSALRAA